MSSLGALPEDPVALLMAIDQVNQRRSALEEERAMRAFQQQRMIRQDELAEQAFAAEQEALKRQQAEQGALGGLMAIGDQAAREQAAAELLESGEISPGAYIKQRQARAAAEAAELGIEQKRGDLYRSGIETEKAEMGLQQQQFQQQFQQRKFEADQFGRGLRALYDKNGKLMPGKWPLVRAELIKSGVASEDDLPVSFGSAREMQEYVDSQNEFLEVQNEFLAEPEKVYELSKRQQEIKALMQRRIISEEEGNRQLRASGIYALREERQKSIVEPGSQLLKDIFSMKENGILPKNVADNMMISAVESEDAADSISEKVGGLTTGMKTKIQGDEFAYRTLNRFSKEFDNLSGQVDLEQVFEFGRQLRVSSLAQLERIVSSGNYDKDMVASATKVQRFIENFMDQIRRATTGQAASDQELRRLMSRLHIGQSITQFRASLAAILQGAKISRDVGQEMLVENADMIKRASGQDKQSVFGKLKDDELRRRGVLSSGMTEDQAEAQAWQELGNTGASDEQIIQRMNELMGQ